MNKNKDTNTEILSFGRLTCTSVESNPSEYNCFLHQWFHCTLPGLPSEIAGETLIFTYFVTFKQLANLNIAADDCSEVKCGELMLSFCRGEEKTLLPGNKPETNQIIKSFMI